MKKLLLVALAFAGLIVGNVSAHCRSCGSTGTFVEDTCEPRPTCEYQVTKFKPAKKHCKRECWYTCPKECVRREGTLVDVME